MIDLNLNLCYYLKNRRLIMALSDSVKSSLQEAEPYIRNALAYSARQERPQTTLMIARILYELDSVIKIDQSNDIIENIINKFKGNGDLNE